MTANLPAGLGRGGDQEVRMLTDRWWVSLGKSRVERPSNDSAVLSASACSVGWPEPSGRAVDGDRQSRADLAHPGHQV
jgi:hypothetical protein